MSAIDPKQFGAVGVLMGGWSAEREISLKSGLAVFEALKTAGVDAYPVDVDRDIASVLARRDFDRVFVCLHGRGGEDGVIQGLLEAMGTPYTGSGVLGSALGMDKLRTKQLWRGADLPTPAWRSLASEADCEAAVAELGLPLIVKPALEGSSIGMSKVESAADARQALATAAEYGPVIAEQWIEGGEYTVSLLGERALPVIRLETPHAFYDFQAKYEAEDTGYFCPAGLARQAEHDMQTLAVEAFETLGGSGWGRVDLMRDSDGNNWLLEINTVPGMTDHSLVPIAAEAAGMDFRALVLAILETAEVAA